MMGGSLMVEHSALDRVILVQVQASQRLFEEDLLPIEYNIIYKSISL